MGSVKYEALLRAHVLERHMCTDGKQRWVAWFPDFPKCRAQGDTDTEAVQTLYDLYPKYREAMTALGVSDLGLSTEQRAPQVTTTAVIFESAVTKAGPTSTGERVPA